MSRPIKINIGGGKNHPKVLGWTIVDLRPSADVVVDISKDPLPFADNSVSLIFCSHTLEHIYPHRLLSVILDFHRVLAPNGILRVSVPDIERAMRACVSGDRDFFLKCDVSHAKVPEGSPIQVYLQNFLYSSRADDSCGNGHVNGFDFFSLRWWLERAGFLDVHPCGFRSSRYSRECAALDLHPVESLFVEAVK